MSEADTTFSINTNSDINDLVKSSLYEYEFAELFSRSEERKDKPKFIETVNFKLSFLNVENVWNVVKLDGDEQTGLYSVQRRLNFLPFSETQNKWSLTLDLSDKMLVGYDTPERRDRKFPISFQEFKNLTATNEKPFVEFSYDFQENERVPIFTRLKVDYWSEMKFSVTDCKGLDSYLGLSIDFTSSFDESNVILELDDGKRLYFVLELLAVNSPIFYEKWQNRTFLTKEDDHYLIPMEDTDINGLILILKMIAYKNDRSKCTETVAMVAKKWKFDMILVACEDVFIANMLKYEQIPKYNHFAQIYDMSQLQNTILLKTDELIEKTNTTDAELAQVTGRPPQPVDIEAPEYLEHITAEKFSVPEIRTVFVNNGPMPLNFASDNRKSWNCTIRALLDWAVSWKYLPSGDVKLAIYPRFLVKNTEQKSFNPINWSVHATFTVVFNGNEKKFNGFFNPRSKKVTDTIEKGLKDVENIQYPYTIKIEIKCVKGLRYFVNDWKLRAFDVRMPTSDVVLKCKDKKIFANMTILSFCSSFFKGLKEHSDMRIDMDEQENLPCVNMEDVWSIVMGWILNYCYSIHRSQIETVQMEHIVPVADRFLFIDLLHKCEHQLINATNYPLGLKTLDFAIRYHLFALKDAYLKHFQCIGDIQKLKDDPSYQTISDAAKVLLCERVMELPIVI